MPAIKMMILPALRILVILLSVAALASGSSYISKRSELFGFINTSQSVFRYRASSIMVYVAFLACTSILFSTIVMFVLKRSIDTKRHKELSSKSPRFPQIPLLIESVIFSLLWLASWAVSITECMQMGDISNTISRTGIPGSNSTSSAVDLAESADSSCTYGVAFSTLNSIAFFASAVALSFR